MLKWLVIAAALGVGTTAHAAPDWTRVDSRAETTYTLANWGVLGGLTAGLVGGLAGDTRLAAAGDLVYTGAMATSAAATLRQRRSIVERGVPTTAAWGYASWGLQVASVGLGIGSRLYLDAKDYDHTDERGIPDDDRPVVMAMTLGGLACSIGAILTSSAQHRENAYRRSLIGRSAIPERRLHVYLQPTVGVDGEPGLAAVGLF